MCVHTFPPPDVVQFAISGGGSLVSRNGWLVSRHRRGMGGPCSFVSLPRRGEGLVKVPRDGCRDTDEAGAYFPGALVVLRPQRADASARRRSFLMATGGSFHAI
eukprot:TRINITY_DN859_c0_g1_i1.p2 TRINITY_DN859_c0_g1~~TRINITY_DN859_c0_g1_i1.p2  ORF type:complete len:104 (-),score=3.25 TRINITY_DN859_c0_g1_i1:15-326(-)